MGSEWIKVALQVEGADPEEAAGIISDETGKAVEIVELVDEASKLIVWFKKDEVGMAEALALISRISGEKLPGMKKVSVSVEAEAERDWLLEWKKSFKPLLIGEKLVIIPSWGEDQAPQGRTPLMLDPGMAFGTGHHATTAGCLILLEKYIGKSALDIGCGSGVLAIAAAKLGAKNVVAVDNDAEAIPVAISNVKKNDVAESVRVYEGSVSDINGKFDVVVANLFFTPLIKMADELYERVAGEGVLIASGLKSDQAVEVDEAFRNTGLTPVDVLDDGEWVTLAYRKE